MDSAKSDRLLKEFPQRFKVFQFHQDTFEIPANCIRLAKSDRYPNQAFRYEDFIWAIQFHLEMDENVINDCAIALEQGLKDSGIDDLTIEQTIEEGKKLSPLVQPLADRFMQEFLEI
ncbi:MAG: hypothetical protein MUD14_19505 [Hydrococcus sp. Prado102]|nr:hypothetical protein [Hydrococcus sp. Prado102]